MGATGPRLLFVDIETAPILMTSWSMRAPYAGAVWVERDTHLLCFAARWGDHKQTKTYALPDYPGYSRDRYNDKKLCGDLFKLLDAADIVIAHNGDAFDIKKINSRLLLNGYGPPSPYKTLDTLKFARKFKFDSNKLDNLGRYLGVGRKIPNTGATLWRGCVEGDPASWRKMRSYNKRDVDLLVEVYDELKPWIPNHIDLTMWGSREGCPVCQSLNTLRRGYNVAASGNKPRFQCKDCKHWWSGKLIKRTAA